MTTKKGHQGSLPHSCSSLSWLFLTTRSMVFCLGTAMSPGSVPNPLWLSYSLWPIYSLNLV